ncbi:ankyrin domain protein [Moelleriella libera RCEF 2490]|uniref:Ankyrin domain protein n=1 Tax=Moelleriella libera RCEF 2490 TaxID=1081109 RepID=A0A166RNH9_9HYPO|nr:ankyrin domain protein [Moelleriella libera RCEF 2490]
MNFGANLVVETSAWADKVGALKALLEEGVDPDGRDSKEATTLHHLGSPVLVKKSPRRCFHEAGIRMLLQCGASATIQDHLGNTPLHHAAFGSDMHIFSIYAAGLPADSRCNDELQFLQEQQRGDTSALGCSWQKDRHTAIPVIVRRKSQCD